MLTACINTNCVALFVLKNNLTGIGRVESINMISIRSKDGSEIILNGDISITG